jgi:tRNA (cmo5U34)-methyltransferase
MSGDRGAGQYHFDPDTYLDLVMAEVPHYVELQDELARATAGIVVHQVLELGVGTGETSVRVLAVHPSAHFVGIDESAPMLARARPRLAGADLRVQRLEDPLPDATFDLVVSALAVHHLDGPAKADLFRRAAARLRPGGRIVVGDVVVPDDPADVVTPVDGVYDQPSRVGEQLEWLRDAGLRPAVAWCRRDLAVLVADRPDRPG